MFTPKLESLLGGARKFTVTFIDGEYGQHQWTVLAKNEKEAETIATELMMQMCGRNHWDKDDFTICDTVATFTK